MITLDLGYELSVTAEGEAGRITIRPPHSQARALPDITSVVDLAALRQLKAEVDAALAQALSLGGYTCTSCRINYVDAEGGYDTCDECLRKI